jgi:rhomboid protease GluP
MPVTWPVIAGNVVVIQTALIAASYLYYAHRGRPASWRPRWSLLLIVVTALVTGAQFLFPDVLPALRRDLDGLRDGEWWRVVTPLFVQPDGVPQALSNALFLAMFLPIAEKIFGWNVLVIYFTAGLLVQIDRYYWDPTGGGSSSAAFGVIGGLCTYIVRRRRELPWPVVMLGIAGFVGAIILTVAHDGHGPGFLIGATVATALPSAPIPTAAREAEPARA